ncbi:hypothetical protein JOM56_001400 [Amanita muscaria]
MLADMYISSTISVCKSLVLAAHLNYIVYLFCPEHAPLYRLCLFCFRACSAEVDARAYDEESELYAQGGAISTKKIHKPRSATPHYGSSEYDNHLVTRGYVLSRDGSSGTPPYTSHFRRSFYEPPRYELTRRHQYLRRDRIPNDRSSPFSPPSSPDISRPFTPAMSTPPTPGTPSTPVGWNFNLGRVSNGRLPPAPGDGERTVVGSPGSSRPSTPTRVPNSPDSGRSRSPSRSPGWRRPPNSRSRYTRSFYDLD